MTKPYVSVVIPCFEEMSNLQKGVLEKVELFFSKKKYSSEIIIVDDGSKDGSVEFVQKFIKDYPTYRLIKNSHMGKAGAVTTGILSAKGEYVLFTDMDQATPIEEIDKLLPLSEEGTDIVIGSRAGNRKGAPLIRLFISRANIVLRKLVVGIGSISDTQCGFKLFRAEAAKELFQRIYDIHHGFKTIHGSSVSSGFDVELLYIAQQMGYSMKEVPVTWLYVETRRVSPVKDSIKGVEELLRIKYNIIKGMYRR